MRSSRVAPDDVHLAPNGTAAARNRPWAAVSLALAGLAVIIGSFLMWDACAHVPCELEGLAIQTVWLRSGVEIGPGILTAVCGALLALAGIVAVRRGGRSPFKTEAVALGLLAVVVPAVYVIVAHSSRTFALSQPTYGFWVVVGAGALAIVAAGKLPNPGRASRAWALERRGALTLLICGVAIWLLVLAGVLPVRLEPLTYVVVLTALGLALWPSRPPPTESHPAGLGAGLILYGALALATAPFNREPIALLEIAPIVPIVLLAARRILRELPPLDPPLVTGPAARWRNEAVTALNSSRVVLAGGFMLTAAALVLLLTRLIGTEDGPGWLARSGTMSPRVVVILLLIAAGIATAAYIVWRFFPSRHKRAAL